MKLLENTAKVKVKSVLLAGEIGQVTHDLLWDMLLRLFVFVEIHVGPGKCDHPRLHPSTLSSPLGESSRSEGTTSRYPSRSSGVPQDSGAPCPYHLPNTPYNKQLKRLSATACSNRSNSVLSVS